MQEIVELTNKTITIDRNEFLKVKGSIDRNVYFVENGSLRVFVLDEYEEQTIRFGYKDNLIVSLDSFLTGKPSELYIQAIISTLAVCLIYQKKVIFAFMKDFNEKKLTCTLKVLGQFSNVTGQTT